MRQSSLVTASLFTVVNLSGVFALAGYGQSTPADTKIIGGQAVPDTQMDARRMSTVALTTDVARSSGGPLIDDGHSFCSGTIISRRAIVTAAHCLQKFDADTREKLDELILPSETDFLVQFDIQVARAGRWIRATRVIPHPDWSPADTLTPLPTRTPNDLGLIILSEDIPAHTQPVRLADVDMELTDNQDVLLAGFGVTRSRNTNDTGILRQVTTPLKDVNADAQRITVGAFFRGACAGDSGGPAYVRVGNELQLVGATSTGAELAGNCLGLINNYTDLRYSRDWINSVLMANQLDPI